jgi:hypothetical protein
VEEKLEEKLVLVRLFGTSLTNNGVKTLSTLLGAARLEGVEGPPLTLLWVRPCSLANTVSMVWGIWEYRLVPASFLPSSLYTFCWKETRQRKV